MRTIIQHATDAPDGMSVYVTTTTVDDAGTYTTETALDLFDGNEPATYHTGGQPMIHTTHDRIEAERIHNRQWLTIAVNHGTWNPNTYSRYIEAITA